MLSRFLPRPLYSLCIKESKSWAWYAKNVMANAAPSLSLPANLGKIANALLAKALWSLKYSETLLHCKSKSRLDSRTSL